MARRIRIPDPRRPFPREMPALCVAAALVFTGCSRGESDLLNPRGPRGDIAPPPDTVSLGDATQDRTHRPKIDTGAATTLFVMRNGVEESIIYLRWNLSSLPDTAGVREATLGLRYHGTGEGPATLVAYEVSADESDWTEETVREPLSLESSRAYPGLEELDSPGDTTLVIREEFTLPEELIRRWKNDSGTNRGLAIRIAAAAPPGGLAILSKEAAVSDTATNAQINPRLEIFRIVGGERQSVLEEPREDCSVFTTTAPYAAGSEPTLVVGDRPASRALLRFSVPESLVGQFHTVNRASLRLRVVPGSVAPGESLLVGVYRALGPWEEGTEPDSLARATVAEDLERVRATTDTLTLECAAALQPWFDGEGDLGLVIRSVYEGWDTLSVRFYSREAEPGLGPSLVVVHTPPPPPRWGAAP